MVRSCRGPLFATLAVLVAIFPGIRMAAGAEVRTMGLSEFLTEVLEYNEEIQLRLLEFEISRKQVRAEEGIFEPEVFLNTLYEDVDRPNTAEESQNQGGLNRFRQRSFLYATGVEMLLKSGGRARFGLDNTYLKNNLQVFRNVDREYTTFLGLRLTQPLLRGAGKSATLSAIRVASLESEQAFQEYRRQTMVILAGAELAYWNLYYAQEQETFFLESQKLAEQVLKDNESAQEAGRATELTVLAARAALAERVARSSLARQAGLEASNLAAFFLAKADLRIRANSPPLITATDRDFETCLSNAIRFNPDYRSGVKQVSIESVRLDFARNQKRPQLDLIASFGASGLADNYGDSLSRIGDGQFPTWSIGLEFRMPIGGRKRTKSQYEAAILRRQRAFTQLQQLNLQIRQTIQNALLKVKSTRDSTRAFETAVTLNRQLLDSEMESHRQGRSPVQIVMETEEQFFQAKNIALQSVLEHQRAVLELEAIMGTLLDSRDIDYSQAELERRSTALIRQGRLSQEDYDAFRASTRQLFQNP